VTHDSFHIIKRAGEAISELRREQFFRAGPELRAVGRGSRWLGIRCARTVVACWSTPASVGRMADRKTWAKRVAAWRASGLTCKEFAEREGLGPWRTLQNWAWRIERERRASKGQLVRVVRAPSPVVVAARPSEVTELELRVGESRISVRFELGREEVASMLGVFAAALHAVAAKGST
jgi:hypothetical protein